MDLNTHKKNDYSIRTLAYYEAEGGIFNSIITQLQRLRSCMFYTARKDPCLIISNAERVENSFLLENQEVEADARLKKLVEKEKWKTRTSGRWFDWRSLSYASMLCLLSEVADYKSLATRQFEQFKETPDVYVAFKPVVSPPPLLALPVINIVNNNYSIDSNVLTGVVSSSIMPIDQMNKETIEQLQNILKSWTKNQK